MSAPHGAQKVPGMPEKGVIKSKRRRRGRGKGRTGERRRRSLNRTSWGLAVLMDREGVTLFQEA